MGAAALLFFAALCSTSCNEPESPKQVGEQSAVQAESAAFYWFSTRALVDAGNSFYGSFVYERFLPLITVGNQGSDSGWFVLFDGDALIPITSFSDYLRPEDSVLIQRQAALNDDIWYTIAIFGSSDSGWEEGIDRELRKSRVLGYQGMTVAREPNRETFVNACKILSLPVTARLDGSRFKKIGFSYMSDDALRALGFDPYVE